MQLRFYTPLITLVITLDEYIFSTGVREGVEGLAIHNLHA